MSSRSFKKKDLVLLKKKFISKIDVNKCFARLSQFEAFQFGVSLVHPSANLLIKTHLYDLSKRFKELKLIKSTDIMDSFSLKLQSSKLYDSFVENERRLLIFKLERKILDWRIHNLGSLKVLDFTMSDARFVDTDIKHGFCTYNNFTKVVIRDKQNKLLHFFRARNFFDSLFVNRFSYQLSLKKKYRLNKQGFDDTKSRILYLVSLYKLGFLKYIKAKYKFKKVFGKLVWRRKKRKKWKQSVLFRFFRSRHRLFYKFYIPKYLEINYKTFSFVHLDSIDISSLHPRFSFWLNLRRLLTFLSS